MVNKDLLSDALLIILTQGHAKYTGIGAAKTYCGIAALGKVMGAEGNYCYFAAESPERELLEEIAKKKRYSDFYELNDHGGYREVVSAYIEALAT